MRAVGRLGVALLPALLALALGVPSAAPAATVFADVNSEEGYPSGTTEFTAARGERNRLTVRLRDGRLVFRDARARVRARGDCRSIDRHTASCLFGEGATIVLGDRDDALQLTATIGAHVSGGRGDDRLVGGGPIVAGGPGDDTLLGGPEYDRLIGGAGRDRLSGGPGDDQLDDAELDRQSARDTFDGGPGSDLIDYSLRRRSLRIDLRRTRGPGGDSVTAIENVRSGSGDDVLTGDASDNALTGGAGRDVIKGGAGGDAPMGLAGNDRLSGEAGNDVVWGGRGSDRISGGAGDDLLQSNEVGDRAGRATADRLTCGPGADTVESDGQDALTLACETLWAAGVRLATVPVLRDGVAEFSASCGTAVDRCGSTLALYGPADELYGRAGFQVPPPRGEAIVSVPFSEQAAAALRAGVLVRVELSASSADPLSASGGYRTFLRTP